MQFALRRFLISLAITALFSTVPALAQEGSWSRFRGPNGEGIQRECLVPLPWTSSDLRWKIPLPGDGNGSPVIWNEKYFVMCADPKSAERKLVCGSMKSGEIEWVRSFPASTHALHNLSSYASCTPCVDENRVYCAWATPESYWIKAFDHQGNEQWSQDRGRYVSQHGFGSSPILVDDLLVIANSQDAQELPEGVEPGSESVLALDKATGQLRWETPLRPTRVCYGTMCVGEDQAGKKVLYGANTQDGFFAIQADSGKLLWSKTAFGKRVCSSPILVNLAGEKLPWLIATEGSGGGGSILVAVEANPSAKEVLRVTRGAPYVPTPIVAGNLAFLWADNGIVTCLDLPSGKTLWTERVGGNYSSSPIILRNRLIGVSQDGVVHILAAASSPEKIGRIELEQTVRATPAATNDALLLRTSTELICVGAR